MTGKSLYIRKSENAFLQYLGIGRLMLGKIEGKRRRGGQDEMVGWRHQLGGLEFEQARGVDDGQGGLVCCSPWGRRVRHD